jgi:hypothetical protein
LLITPSSRLSAGIGLLGTIKLLFVVYALKTASMHAG